MPSSPTNRLEPLWPQPAGKGIAPVDASQIASRADAWRKRVEQLMGDHPQVTVMAAAAAGIFLGWLVKRK